MEDKLIEDFWSRETEYMGEKVAKTIFRLSKKYIGKDVLDIGAGTAALIKLIPNAQGIDIAPKSDRVKKGDIEKLEFKDNSFDTVFACELIEHLSNKKLQKGIEEIWRVLKQDGFFILTLPCKEKLGMNDVTCPKCKFKFNRYFHKQAFDDEKVRLILNKFKVIRLEALPLGVISNSKFFTMFPGLAKRLANQIRKYIKTNKEGTYFIVAKRK